MSQIQSLITFPGFGHRPVLEGDPALHYPHRPATRSRLIQIEDNSALLEQLETILGPGGLSRDETGSLLLSPASIDELRDLITVAGSHSTSITFGFPARSATPNGSLQLSIRRLDRIIEIDPENLTARVEAGVPHPTLSDALAEFNLIWPVAPMPGHESLADSVLSGFALGNSGLFPDLRHWVLGATVVARDGLIFQAGGRTIKNSSGYDLTRAGAGAGGLFGVAAKLQLRLERRPEVDRVAPITLSVNDEAAAVLALATANLDLVRRLSVAATPAHPLTARLTLAGRSEAVDSLSSHIETQHSLSDDDIEDRGLTLCATAGDSLVSWTAGPHTCLAIALELNRQQPASAVVALPMQRRGFVTGPEPDRIATIIAGSGATPIHLPDGFTSIAPSKLLAPPSRPFAVVPLPS